MTERRWPVKIYITWEHFGDSAPGRSFSASDRVYPDYPGFIRADIAEGMADALEWIAAPQSCGCVPCTGQCKSRESLLIIVEEMQDTARSALSAFRSATQDTEACHD